MTINIYLLMLMPMLCLRKTIVSEEIIGEFKERNKTNFHQKLTLNSETFYMLTNYKNDLVKH